MKFYQGNRAGRVQCYKTGGVQVDRVATAIARTQHWGALGMGQLRLCIGMAGCSTGLEPVLLGGVGNDEDEIETWGSVVPSLCSYLTHYYLLGITISWV